MATNRCRLFIPGSCQFCHNKLDDFASMLQCALDEQKKKLEGDMARHLAFIDRLLADKDKLSAKCMQLGKDMKVNCTHPKLPLLAVNVYLLHQN